MKIIKDVICKIQHGKHIILFRIIQIQIFNIDTQV